jgi:hypothetical protein
LLDRADRLARDGLLVQELVGLLVDQHLVARGHGHASLDLPPPEGFAEEVAEVHHAAAHAPHAGLAGDVEHRQRVRVVGHLQLDDLVVQLARAEFLAEHLAGLFARIRAGERLDHAVFGGAMGLGLHALAQMLLGHQDRRVHQVAHDLLHVAADIAHLGELGGLHLQERRAGKLGQAAADFGLADPGGPDHQDVLGVHLIAQIVAQLPPPPAIAERHGHGTLGILLADDETVELGDDLAGGQLGHGAIVSTVRFPLV